MINCLSSENNSRQWMKLTANVSSSVENVPETDLEGPYTIQRERRMRSISSVTRQISSS